MKNPFVHLIVFIQLLYYVCRYGPSGAAKRIDAKHKELTRQLEELKKETKTLEDRVHAKKRTMGL